MNSIILAVALAWGASCDTCSGWSNTDQAGAGVQYNNLYAELSMWQETYRGQYYTGQEVLLSLGTDAVTISGGFSMGDYEQQTLYLTWRF